MNKEQLKAAEKAMVEWLSHPEELGKEPLKIECTKEFDLHDLHYYIFRFKDKLLGEWMLGFVVVMKIILRSTAVMFSVI